MPSPELCAFLKREGVEHKKKARFRPLKVDAAIDFLLNNNVVYSKAWGKLRRTRIRFAAPGDTEETERDLSDDMFVDMTGEEGDAVDAVMEEQEKLSSVESDFVLYHNDNDEPIDRDDHIRMNLDIDPRLDAELRAGRFNLPRPDVASHNPAHPSKDNAFYEKCFPSLIDEEEAVVDHTALKKETKASIIARLKKELEEIEEHEVE